MCCTVHEEMTHQAFEDRREGTNLHVIAVTGGSDGVKAVSVWLSVLCVDACGSHAVAVG
jgi:hypothetical protein